MMKITDCYPGLTVQIHQPGKRAHGKLGRITRVEPGLERVTVESLEHHTFRDFYPSELICTSPNSTDEIPWDTEPPLYRSALVRPTGQSASVGVSPCSVEVNPYKPSSTSLGEVNPSLDHDQPDSFPASAQADFVGATLSAEEVPPYDRALLRSSLGSLRQQLIQQGIRERCWVESYKRGDRHVQRLVYHKSCHRKAEYLTGDSAPLVHAQVLRGRMLKHIDALLKFLEYD